MVVKAVWNNTVIAESDKTIVVEGFHYFPPKNVRSEYLKPTNTQTMCPWKGIADFYDLVVGQDVKKDAAWYYPNPRPAAQSIQGYVAFWDGIHIETK